DCHPLEWSVVIGHIGDLEREGQRHAVDRVGTVDVRPDVRTHDSGLFEDVRAVGTVCRIRPGGLVGDLRDRTAARTRRARGGGGARGHGRGPDACADESQDTAPAEERAVIECSTLIDDFLVRAVEESALVGGALGGLVWFWYASHALSFLRWCDDTIVATGSGPGLWRS